MRGYFSGSLDVGTLRLFLILFFPALGANGSGAIVFAILMLIVKTI